MRKPPPNTKRLFIEIDERVHEAVQKFRRSRREQLKTVVTAALIRHIASPPTLISPPAPPPPLPEFSPLPPA